jgi:exopolysaccharide biosynthesis polyprenyl glycosylphosphotransferase
MTTFEVGPSTVAPGTTRSGSVATERRPLPMPEGLMLAGFDLAAVLAVYVALRPSLIHVLWAVLLLASSFFSGTYRRPRLALTALGDMKATVVGASGPLMLAGMAALVGFAEIGTVRLAGALVPAVAAGRVLAYRSIRAQRRRGRFIHRAIVVGSGVIADRIIAVLSARPEMGIEIVGHVEDVGVDALPQAGWIGPVDDLAPLVERTGATRVIAAYSHVRDDDLADRLRGLKSTGAEVFVVPRLFEFGSSSGDTRAQTIGEIPIVWLPHREWRRELLWLKRAFDLTLAGVGLVALLPVLGLTALAVRLTSRGPALFRQIRVGQDGRQFVMYKFRSMSVGPAELRQSGGGDSRITKVGAIIRRLSIDELPQLINVVKGEMSIVGPRPEQPYFVESSVGVPGYRSRHRLQVGLTGWSQVNRLRGADTSLEDRARFDNFYIEHWSIWLDTVIVIRTVVAALRGS